MSFRINSKTIVNFLIALFIISTGFLFLLNSAQAAVKIVQFNKITGVTATLQDGGSLAADTTYYVRVVAVESDDTYTLNTVNAQGEPSDEISFTTTETQKQADINWDAVTGNDIGAHYSYYVLISNVSGVYYNKKSNKNYTGLATDITTSYTISSYEG